MKYRGNFGSVRHDALVDALGGKCSCTGDKCWHEGQCGITDKRCLQTDHINGDGPDDRKRLRGVGVIRYYLGHLGEAMEKVQVLCANCNWVKRHTNGEHRNGRESVEQRISCQHTMNDASLRRRVLVESRLASLPAYSELTLRTREFMDDALVRGEVDLIERLREQGIYSMTGRPLSFYLIRRWEKQSFYKEELSDLAGFLEAVERDLDCAVSISGMRKRVR